MEHDRAKEVYRRHTILAAKHDGRFKGRVFKDNQVIHECEGTSIDGLLDVLRTLVDNRLDQIAENREAPPDGEEYVRAFQEILEELSDGHCAMLKAHYHAKNQTMTATELAEAAGYPNYSSVNLQYGLVGSKLNEELPIDLPRRSDGTPIATAALATPGDHNGSEEHWTWKLRPGVAYAIEKLGLHT